jgi:Fe-S cluster biogenesis protein NfuA/nitrite reductase/ring-hydroxylating ferredoxin subunit
VPPPTSSPATRTDDDARWRAAGDRIQTLLDASAAGGVAARERAEQLVGEVTDLYGAALGRMLAIAVAESPALVDRFAADELIASLLLVHGLHPHSVERRVADALDTVRPYLGSHGGDVHLLGVHGGTVRLQLAGNCKSCPSSAVTLELAVEDAVRAAAPEITDIEVVAAETSSGVIPAESLLRRVQTRPAGAWQPVPALAELGSGEIGGFRVAGHVVLACRVGDQVYAYRDSCGRCGASLAGAVLRDSHVRCPQCGAGFDVVRAGAGADDGEHLEPVPVLVHDGVPSIAITQGAA